MSIIDILANVIILLVIPVVGILAAFGDDRELIITSLAIFGIFVFCMFIMCL